MAIAGNGTISSTATITLSQTGLLDVTQVSSGFSTPPNVTVSGTGEVLGGYRHNAGTLEPGGALHAGTLVFSTIANPSALTFGSSVVNVDVGGKGLANLGGGTNDLILVYGDVNFNPNTQFRINYIGESPVNFGDDFPFLYYSGSKSGWGSGTISTTSGIVSTPYRLGFSLKDLGSGVIAAHFNSIGDAWVDDKWVGTQNGIWDLNFSKNFLGNGAATNFFYGDSVTFDDAGINRPNVILANSVFVPAAIKFDNTMGTVNYTLTGLGTIAGTTGLMKLGTGTATINTANTYTGNTTISDGVLSQGNFSALRYGQKVINSPFGLGTIYLGTPAGSSTVSFGSTTFVNDVNVGTGLTGNINFNNGSATVLGAWKNSGTINLTGGGGNLTLFGDHSSETGTVNVIGSGITIRLGNANAAGNLFWNFVSPRTMVGAFNDPTQNEIPIGGISGSGVLLGYSSGALLSGDKTFVIGGRNADSTWDGQIADSTAGAAGSGVTSILTITSLAKTGTASLVLRGTNLSYTGDTTVRQGVLELSNTGGIGGAPILNGGRLTGTKVIHVQNGGTFRLGTPGGTLSTAGTITTAATGLLLSVGFGGTIDVSNVYDTDPIFNPNPPFDVSSYQSFATAPGTTWAGDDGTIIGNVTHSAGTISPGRNGGFATFGTFTFANTLRFAGGAVMMEIGNSVLATDHIDAGTLITNSGSLMINTSGGSAGTNSIYNLMHASSIDIGLGTFALDLRGRGATGTLIYSSNDIQLKILTPATKDALTWNGASGATWDVRGTQNWLNHTNSPDYFYLGDTVTFTSANAGTVILTTPLLNQGTLNVNAGAGSYTFAGPGQLSGASLRVVAGTLALMTNNDYKGNTTIDAGATLALGRDNFNDSTGSYSVFNSSGNGILLGLNKYGTLGTGSVINNGALVFRRSDGIVVNQNISGSGAVYLRDFGTVELRGTSTYSGGTTISWGTLKLGDHNVLPQTGSVTLVGTTNFLGGNNNNPIGRGGKLDLNGYSQTIEELNAIGSNGIGGGPMDAYIYNTATLTDAVSTLTINRTGTLGFNSAIRMGSEGNDAPIGQIALVKRSSGVATMNYTTTGTINTNYSGRTTINGGTLVVRGTHSPAGGTSYGTYSVNGPNLGASSYNTGGVLAGDGTITAKIEVNPGGIVAPAFGGVAPTSTLTVDSMSLNSSTILFNLAGANSDRINIVADNGWTLSGTPKVNLNVVGSLTAGTFTLVDYSGANISNLAGSAGALLQLGTINNAGTFAFNLYSNVEQSSLQLIVTQPAATATWKVDGNGLWNNSTNWTSDPTTPNAFGSVVNFGSISSARTVTMDNPFSVGTANFTSAAGFTIAGDSSTTLTFANLTPGGGIGINVTNGSHTIISPVLFWNDGTININGGSTLTISGGLSTAINGVGHSITKIGSGTLMVQGIRSTFGNNGSTALNVQQGTLRVIQKPTANAPEGTTKVNSLSIANVARLDLTNNSMVIDYGSLATPSAILAQLRGWLNSADARLYSSSADSLRGIGFKDNLDLSGLGNNAVLNFAGVTADTTSILLRYTYLGDTNVDGQVDISDLYNLASNYTPSHAAGMGSGVWQAGDFNYDGWTDLTDLSVLAKNWQAGVASPLGASLGSLLATLGLPQVAVPEPGSIGLLGLGLTGLMSRRRRRL